MKVDVYAICWNEVDLVDHFFDRYDPVASRYIFFDDGSTDGTLEKIAAHPLSEIRRFERSSRESYVLSAQALHNSVWKESRGTADWALITAVDEHLVHPDLPAYLRRCLAQGVTMIPAVGFQMVSDTFPNYPDSLSETVTHGAPFPKMSKVCLLRPSEIEEINYRPGRHQAEPQGNVVLPARDEVLNLHYKYLDFDRLRDRHVVLATGLGEKDIKNGWGHRYLFDEAQLKADFEGFRDQSYDLARLDHDAVIALHDVESRWWRSEERGFPSADEVSTKS